MKKIILITLTCLGLLTNNSCKKEKKDQLPTVKEVLAEKKNVKTYELIDLTTKQSLSDKYTGTFGSLSIELVKTSDTTLSFYVPDVSAGAATLKFELATIEFNVSKTIVLSADVVINNLNQKFDDQVQTLPASTPEEIADVKNLNDYRQEVLALFNGLTVEQKTQALLIYEANKAEFQTFANNTFTNLDAATAMRLQSECPKTNFREFYNCTGENLGTAAAGLKKSSKDFLYMLTMAGVSAYLAPASFGLSAFGTVLGGGTAAYLLFTELLPASLHFKQALFPYLESRWVFSNALFDVVVADFKSQESTSLNLTPKFRTLTAADGAVSSGTAYFINAMKTLEGYWNKLTAVFGNYPSYKNTETATTLTTSEITISNISNGNVQYLGNTDQSVTFKSVSGKDEAFTYKIRIEKQGFTEEKTLSANVKVNCPTITFGTSMSAEGSIAILNVQGGVAPYMYSVANSPYQSSEIFVGPYTDGGSYQIKIKDVTNCETVGTRVVSKGECNNLTTFTDPRNGKVYKVVQIGGQLWMAENLNYATGNSWCYGDNTANCDTYGRLYDWPTATNACPSGWHLPSDAEWTTLENTLGGSTVAGDKMKTKGTTWQNSATTGANSSCFSGLPGGSRSEFNGFGFLGDEAIWWSSTAYDAGTAWTRNLIYYLGALNKYNSGKGTGMSVRCVKN
jgi:uncharacterized protein (TIGR02145 family)